MLDGQHGPGIIITHLVAKSRVAAEGTIGLGDKLVKVNNSTSASISAVLLLTSM